MMPVAPAPAQIAIPEPEPVEKTQDVGVDFNDIIEVKSPLVGVFYAAPSPEAEPFVKVGDRIKKGEVLCVVEAMKLMNEITATHDGEIVDICITNGAVVEFGQTLFKLY
jgi:acetyl-CoA carboxylase biotin carboxyl carrier protein